MFAAAVGTITLVLGARIAVVTRLKLAYRDAHACSADAGVAPKVALRPCLDRRVQASTGHRVAGAHRARVVVLALHALAQAHAHALGALTRKLIDLTDRTVDPVRIGAGPIARVAYILGAVVIVGAVDITAELSVYACSNPTYTVKAVEVALSPVWPVLVRACAVCLVADVFGAFVFVIAIDAFTKPDAYA